MATPRRVIDATPHVDFRPSLAGWGHAAYGVGYDGAIYAAARRPSSDRFAPGECLVVRALEGEFRTLAVSGVSTSLDFVQPFPGGVLLVASARRRGGMATNAFVVDWSGSVQRRLDLGDGIQDVRTTPDGDIWVSYFDEGVSGNLGWPDPGPSCGLLRFDTQGQVRFAYDPAAAGTGGIDDAYAINAADDGTVWVYFYSSFPIVRIGEGGYRAWKLGVAGANALAVRSRTDSNELLLFGDHDERSLARLVTLDGAGGCGLDARVVEEVRIEDGRGGSMDAALAYGKGESLFFFMEEQAFAVSRW